ncbi:hypothetical protein H8A95_15870 [Bradyrhizobium sp. Pear76]|nr:hypothetical protein [Bradyrhizobium oropedii]
MLIHAGPNGCPALIGLEQQRKFDLFDAFWFAKPQHAELVLMRVQSDFRDIGAERPQGWVDLPVRQVRDRLVNAAAELGARWRTLAVVKADAERAVDEVLVHVEKSRQEGRLKDVNARYKIHREQQAAKGEKSIPYSAYLADFTRQLVVLAATNADQRRDAERLRGFSHDDLPKSGHSGWDRSNRYRRRSDSLSE